MRLANYFPFLLLVLVACAPQPKNEFLANPTFCNVDADCTCGGIDTQTDGCFIGNKLYASKYVDFSVPCPDFCSGIDGQLVTRCIDNDCRGVREPIACLADAKLCQDGTAVGRTGPNCEFAPCPGEECSTDADCVPAQCCHATDCVSEVEAPNCAGMFCTEECRGGTIDCGGGCSCVDGKCNAYYVDFDAPIAPDESETKESCLEKGGSWERRFIGYICNFPTTDAGKSCTDRSQCEGQCMSDDLKVPGTCSDYQYVYGCIAVVENGEAVALCID